MYAVLLKYRSQSTLAFREIIDTPGIRDIHVTGTDAANLSFSFPEIAVCVTECGIPACTHTHEPNCAVVERVMGGAIHPDRYESYVRIYDELIEREKRFYDYE
jgi:ribosome biogenesis GTPase